MTVDAWPLHVAVSAVQVQAFLVCHDALNLRR